MQSDRCSSWLLGFAALASISTGLYAGAYYLAADRVRIYRAWCDPGGINYGVSYSLPGIGKHRVLPLLFQPVHKMDRKLRAKFWASSPPPSDHRS